MRSRWPIVILASLLAPYAIYQWFHLLGPAHVFATITGVVLVTALAALFFSVRNALASPDEVPLELGSELPERSALLEEKTVLLRALKDVENEHALGKLSDADYERLRDGYRARAKEVLARLDQDLGRYLDQARALAGEAGPRGRPYVAKSKGRADRETEDEAKAEAAAEGATSDATDTERAEPEPAASPAPPANALAAKLASLPEDKRKEAEAYLAKLVAEPSADPSEDE